MSPSWYELPQARRAAAEGDFGCVLKLARTALHLTQHEAGVRAGYSAATISRFETGAQKLVDLAVLRRLSDAFGIPRELFGLSEKDVYSRRDTTSRVRWKEGDLMRRRQVIGGMAAAIGVGLHLPAPDGGSVHADLANLLLNTQQAAVEPIGLAALRSMLDAARQDFRACRLQEVTARLPLLVRTAVATRDAQSVDRQWTAISFCRQAMASPRKY